MSVDRATKELGGEGETDRQMEGGREGGREGGGIGVMHVMHDRSDVPVYTNAIFPSPSLPSSIYSSVVLHETIQAKGVP